MAGTKSPDADGSPRTIKREQVIAPVVAEKLEVHANPHPTHGIRVHREVETHSETIDMPVKVGQVDIRRVMKNEAVDGPLPARQEGDLLIVPVVEEEIVVTRRFVLKEEVQIRTKTVEKRHTETVDVSRQHAEIERVDADGNVSGVVPEGARPVLDPKPPRKLLLDDVPAAKTASSRIPKTRIGGHIPALDPKRNPSR